MVTDTRLSATVSFCQITSKIKRSDNFLRRRSETAESIFRKKNAKEMRKSDLQLAKFSIEIEKLTEGEISRQVLDIPLTIGNIIIN